MVRMTSQIWCRTSAKFDSVVEDVVERHATGQPVLIGTTSVEKSEHLSNELKKNGVPHEVLNAKNHEREAAIVAQAGRKGAVTVATNMAGRGTDIMLGGNPEFMASAQLAQKGLSAVNDPDAYEAALPEALASAQEAVQAEHDEVIELGGLMFWPLSAMNLDVSTTSCVAARVDRVTLVSLSSTSLEDDLMRLFAADMVDSFLRRFNVPDDVPIEAKMVTNAIRSAQSQVESQNFEPQGRSQVRRRPTASAWSSTGSARECSTAKTSKTRFAPLSTTRSTATYRRPRPRATPKIGILSNCGRLSSSCIRCR